MEGEIFEVKRELAVLSLVSHQNLITFYGACISKEEIMFVMSVTKHGNLREFLKHFNSSLTDKQRIKIALDIANGMVYFILIHFFTVFFFLLSLSKAFLHRLGIIHRDLKSRNVMVDQDSFGTYISKIIDFGTSRLVPSDHTRMTNAVGTVCWMSPEILKGEPYTQKADVYRF